VAQPVSDARAAILDSVRAATRDVPGFEPPAFDLPAFEAPTPGDPALLAERIADYRATITRVDDPAALGDAIAAALARHGAVRCVVPSDLPAALRPGGIEFVNDEPHVDRHALTTFDGVLTTCALAISITGTVVLDHGPGQGRRALTLLPDLHVCIVRVDQVVPDVPHAIAALDPTRPITLISGPSATSDIELDRVEGVHGPRRLEAILVG
jgi:L-lactate dehydrogenase complex protein LldG